MDAIYFLEAIKVFADYQWAEGFRSMQRALDAAPHKPRFLAGYGNFRVRLGSHEAIGYLERAARLDPLNSLIGIQLGVSYLVVGRQLDGLRVIGTVWARDEDYYLANVIGAVMSIDLGRIDEAEKRLERARDIAGDN